VNARHNSQRGSATVTRWSLTKKRGKGGQSGLSIEKTPSGFVMRSRQQLGEKKANKSSALGKILVDCKKFDNLVQHLLAPHRLERKKKRRLKNLAFVKLIRRQRSQEGTETVGKTSRGAFDYESTCKRERPRKTARGDSHLHRGSIRSEKKHTLPTPESLFSLRKGKGPKIVRGEEYAPSAWVPEMG